jgi:hypothetical protein
VVKADGPIFVPGVVFVFSDLGHLRYREYSACDGADEPRAVDGAYEERECA